MRIYQNPTEAMKETERDLWEMGIDVHPQTMQDLKVADNDDFKTKEIQAYGFQVVKPVVSNGVILTMLEHVFGDNSDNLFEYVLQEFADRVDGVARNPGNSYKLRPDVWNQFLHDGVFHYTYSERMNFQVRQILSELREHPDSRQGIINIHTNICPLDAWPEMGDGGGNMVLKSRDFDNMGGSGRIPCSMYYQIMIRNGAVDLIYTMRSCDFLTHFPIDFALALLLQQWYADNLGYPTGMFTYFTASLHAYYKDMKGRGIF